MECNNYSYGDFEKDFRDFLTISSVIHDGWEQKQIETIQYLHKTEIIEKLSNLEKCEKFNNVEDLSCCDIEYKKLCRKDYSIFYSESFNAPILYFNFYKEDGNLLPLQIVWKLFQQNYVNDIKSIDSLYSVITQMEHPAYRKPYYAFHPCKVHDLLEQNLNRYSPP